MAESRPSAFQDVTQGDNTCKSRNAQVRYFYRGRLLAWFQQTLTLLNSILPQPPGGNITCCPYGFYAAPLWDPVTGSILSSVFLRVDNMHDSYCSWDGHSGLGTPNVLEMQAYLISLENSTRSASVSPRVRDPVTDTALLKSDSQQLQVRSSIDFNCKQPSHTL